MIAEVCMLYLSSNLMSCTGPLFKPTAYYIYKRYESEVNIAIDDSQKVDIDWNHVECPGECKRLLLISANEEQWKLAVPWFTAHNGQYYPPWAISEISR